MMTSPNPFSLRGALLVAAVGALQLFVVLQLLDCGASSPAPPPAAGAVFPFNVRAVNTTTGAPIAGVTLTLDGVPAGVTNRAGELVVYVNAGAEHTIAAASPQYENVRPADTGTVHRAGEPVIVWLRPSH